MRPTLNIIGCGKLAKTLAHLWQLKNVVTVQTVITNSTESAQKACQFITAGQPATLGESTQPADLWLIATPDNAIRSIVKQLDTFNLLTPDTILFHCSGSLSSHVLNNSQTSKIASVHPVHSFADPAHSIHSLQGSFCAYEGEPSATETLTPLFAALDCQLIEVKSESKTVYHAASVLACNALVGLLDASLECFEHAGIQKSQAREMLLPIVHQTVDNALLNSPVNALTGPVSRGDTETIACQKKALEALSPQLAAIYTSLGSQTLALAKQQGLDTASSDAIDRLLTSNNDFK